MEPVVQTGRSANWSSRVAGLWHAVHESNGRHQLGCVSIIICTFEASELTSLRYYVPTALENNVGLEPTLALAIGGCVQTMFFFGSLVPTFMLDRLGRRGPMMWGSLGLAISMMMIAILLSFHANNNYSVAVQHATSSASIAFYFTYMFIFGASANCIPWVYVPEILPLHARAKGTSIGISANWSAVMNFPSHITLYSHCAGYGISSLS